MFSGTRFIKNDNSLKCMYKDVWSKIQVYGDDNEDISGRLSRTKKVARTKSTETNWTA